MKIRRRTPTIFIRIAIIAVVYGGFYLFAVYKDINSQNDPYEPEYFNGRKLLQEDDTNFTQAPEATDVVTEVLETERDPDPTQMLKSTETQNDPQGAMNCTPRSINQFPDDFMTKQQRKKGGVIFHLLVTLYIFVALAIVCDLYFVTSVEKICEVLRLQPDVAGATFMAAGSSMPELFTGIISVFISESDVGLGTIVGSAVFNLLMIIALCGLFAGMVLHLTWWPLIRDSMFYLVSIIALTVIILDQRVVWYEALIMLVLYFIYVIIMYFNPKIGKFAITHVEALKEKWSQKPRKCKHPLIEDANEQTPLLIDAAKIEPTACNPTNASTDDASQNYAEKYTEKVGFEHSGTISIHEINPNGKEFKSTLSPPEGIAKKILWIVMFPMNLLFFLTIPDCRRPGCWQNLFPLTFFSSIMWLGGLSYIMVWMVTIAGDTLGIPDSVMGLTFLGAGTSLPDAMASILVARDGYGDMAVSNALGGNIFDILICLGVPWLFYTGIITGEDIHIRSTGLTFATITLIATVIFLLMSMVFNGWRLNKKFGVVYLISYIVIMVFACLFEMNVFVDVNLPPCAV